MNKYYDSTNKQHQFRHLNNILSQQNSCTIVLGDRESTDPQSSPMIGYLTLNPTREMVNGKEINFCFIRLLMIETKYHRRGYGIFLLSICEMLARSLRLEYLLLQVETRNKGSIAFYSKMGFKFDLNNLIKDSGKYTRSMVKCLRK